VQPPLLPPDLRDWLDEDHLAWFVIEAIEEFELEPFYAAYRADGHGRAAQDPGMNAHAARLCLLRGRAVVPGTAGLA
jgi:hypothetical protein